MGVNVERRPRATESNSKKDGPLVLAMKQDKGIDMTRTEQAFLAGVAVVVLMIRPLIGAEAMLIGAGIALLVYSLLFRDRIRKRGWLMTVIPMAIAAVLAAAIAFALTGGK
jgi:hypothetical protein